MTNTTKSFRVSDETINLITTDLEDANVPNLIADHIDWQQVWDCELSHDYFIIEDGDYTHFFNRNF